MASCKSCAAPSVGTLSTFLSPTCRLPQRSAKTVFFFCYWLIRLSCSLPVSQPEPFYDSPRTLMSHMFRWSPTWGHSHALDFVVMVQSCLNAHAHWMFSLLCSMSCGKHSSCSCNFVPDKYAINQTNNCFVHPLSELGPSPFRHWAPAGFSKMEKWFGWGMVMEDESPKFWRLGQWEGQMGSWEPRKCGVLHVPLRLDSDCLSWFYQKGRREELRQRAMEQRFLR